MGIKRYTAVKDSTITNMFKPNLMTRGTGSNAGESDSLEVAYIYGQAASASQEEARILVQFPITSISADRTAGIIPASGSCNFYLRLYNVAHAFTVPRRFTVAIQPVSQSWDEGYGLDIDSYEDDGIVNWTQAGSGSSGYTPWAVEGGDFHTASYTPGTTLPAYTYYFDKGTEDLKVEINSLVEEWIAAGGVAQRDNYGIGVYMTSSITAAHSSSYTKRFSARGSEFFFKRPCIEVQWDNSYKDDRSAFYASSSLAAADDNANGLFLYNYIRGQLKDVPDKGTGTNLYVKMYSDPSAGVDLSGTGIYHTASWSATGIYSASVALDTSASYAYDRWFTDVATTLCIHTGSRITVKDMTSYSYNPNAEHVVAISNLKNIYDQNEIPRFQIFVREKNWNPSIYSVAVAAPEHQIIEDLYFQIKRVTDGHVAIEYGTGSNNHTRCSYNVSGSYFSVDMEILEKDYMYEISFVKKKSSTEFVEMRDKFRFRVE